MNCENKNPCSCPSTNCPNHGKCYECISSHNAKGSMVHCVFPENNGDKSIKNFYEYLKTKFEE